MSRFGRRWMSVVALGGLLLAGSALTTSAGSPSASSFVPMSPCRLFDTRTGSDNVGPRATPLGPAETHTTPVWGSNGNCTVPTGATGISLNVAIVNPTAASFLTVFPGQTALPLAASLNWVAGQAPTPNGVTAALGADGTLSFYNLTGTVDLAVDVVGYYEAAGGSGTPGPKGDPGAPGPRPAQIVWVAKSGGDFTTVTAALSSITDASSSKRYVIKVAPGTYDEPPLNMKSYVDLEGSGSATTIACACVGSQLPANGSNGAAINIGATVVTTISGLTINNNAIGDQYAVGIRTQASVGNVAIRDVSVSALGATTANYGLYLLGGVTVVDSVVTATSPSTGTAHGVSINGSSVVLRRSTASATAGTTGTASGVYAVSASTTLDDSTASGNSGAGDAYGFYASGGSFASVTDSTVAGSSGAPAGFNAYGAFVDVLSTFTRSSVRGAIGGSGGSWGVFTTKASTVTDTSVGGGAKIALEAASGTYTVVVSGSTLTGSTNSAIARANTTVRMTNGVVDGPTTGAGLRVCAFVVNGAGAGIAGPGCP